MLDQPAPRMRSLSWYHLAFKIDVSKDVCVNSMSRATTRLLKTLREIDVSKDVCVNSMSRGTTSLLKTLRETSRMDIVHGNTCLVDLFSLYVLFPPTQTT